jgi:hypothetical protein
VPLSPFEFSYTPLPLLLQLLSPGTAGVPTPEEEVTRAWEGVIAMEASVHEFAVVWESATALVRDAEAQVALARRET